MERFNLNYSKKNIPIPSKHEYKVQLIAKTENLVKRMRWKAIHFLNKLDQSDNETYGFKTRKCPKPVAEMAPFENELMDMIKNLEFRNVNSNFQRQLYNDLKTVKSCPKVIMSADKSRNMYKIEPVDYEKHLLDNITKTYKKGQKHAITKINAGTLKIVKNLGIEDRVERLQETNAYITAKDHKDDFENKPSFRLINPSKSDIGKISKLILDRVNSDMKTAIEANQWTNSHSVIKWFQNLSSKNELQFVQFDIESFYPSISPNLFEKALDFSMQHFPLTESEIEIIRQARKSLLFSKGEPWLKRNGSPEFDVPMGCYDGAEVCEMVGTYILSKLWTVFDKENIGLYRDDGLAVLRNCCGPDTERRKKKIVKIFKDCGLKITIQTGLSIADFLDVKFNLNNETYMPFRKPNDHPVYIHSESNHPPNIKKEIPRMISKRVSELSSNEQVFNDACPMYEQALKDSGFNDRLTYTGPRNEEPNAQHRAKNKRKRKVIWYNPPFSQNVKTNIGRTFIKLVSKHFPRGHKLYRIFNKHTIKISYSCTRNVESIISAHNKKILNPEVLGRECNCNNRVNCPLDNKCLTPNIIYKARVSNDADNEVKNYAGMTMPPFKFRKGNHDRDANNVAYRSTTRLSEYVWNLKDEGKTPNVSYEILHKVQGKPRLGFCRLCCTEKLVIIENLNDCNYLNKRSEFISKCRHINQFSITAVRDTKD